MKPRRRCRICGRIATLKNPRACEYCGKNEFEDFTETTKPISKTDKPTRKELEVQLESLKADKKRLEKDLQERIEDSNKKSIKLDRLQRFTNPQALEDAQKKIVELEYSNYLLDEELACIKIDLSDAERISSEALNRYQKLLADAQQDIVEFNFFMDLLVADAEEQALEVFDEYQKPIEAKLEPIDEEEEGGTATMKPKKKSRRRKKVKHPIAALIAIVIMSILAVILPIMIFNTGTSHPTPYPTPFSIERPTPSPAPTPIPTATPMPKLTITTLKPTLNPTIKPTPQPIIPSETPKSTQKKRRILTGKGKSLPFQIGDTVVGWEITIDGTSIDGGVILYNSPIEGILTDGVINPESWDIHDQRIITLDDILKK